jgi:uncharacterized protein YutE (UPF0331/DUF86 family)
MCARAAAFMADDIILNKAATIERCLGRVREESAEGADLRSNQTRQDAIVLNLQRACEAAIDLAMHLVRKHKLGIPQESRDAFALLERAQILTPDLSARLMRMVGFRDVAVHDYQALNVDIVESIVRERLGDFIELVAIALAEA